MKMRSRWKGVGVGLQALYVLAEEVVEVVEYVCGRTMTVQVQL
jgi:hypothetical protein